ncbi:acetyl-CoA carboxylase biotin carboxyl carrier protein [Candidatus Gromoviella agglomerans]|uniref:acetyl-CoA carboxylase biotin carboxyl carrier protein n=1 Tax=Candidatus Gromoviella agglomerans TaxID=2806609 RepID=UPI001E3E8F6D|nr:biotin/lipoyl-containing protein [Candidatus Gromoviella agglomerans]UFX98462.1 Biotin carboxyl carrier protein of acetyl-CoA carboxylase [Candidatus Gromoviella agglomerans]
MKDNKIDIPYLEEIFNRNKLTHLEYSNSEMTIILKKENLQQNIADYSIHQQQSAPTVEMDSTKKFKSTAVGICYLARSPESEPFIKVGSIVKNGDTLFIVEAMKVMQDIKANFDGTVKKIHVINGSPVEYGQVLLEFE